MLRRITVGIQFDPDVPVDDVVRDLLERERDPARRAAAEAIAAMVRVRPRGSPE